MKRKDRRVEPPFPEEIENWLKGEGIKKGARLGKGLERCVRCGMVVLVNIIAAHDGDNNGQPETLGCPRCGYNLLPPRGGRKEDGKNIARNV